MPDITHEEQAATMQAERFAVEANPCTIRLQRPSHRPTALVERRCQVALHQPEPGAVSPDLVFGIYRGDRILEVNDRRQCGFEDDVGHAMGIGATNGTFTIHDNLNS